MSDDGYDRIILLPELMSRTGLTGSTISRLEKAEMFPLRIRVGTSSANGRVGWSLAEVTAWLEARKAARRAAKSDTTTPTASPVTAPQPATRRGPGRPRKVAPIPVAAPSMGE